VIASRWAVEKSGTEHRLDSAIGTKTEACVKWSRRANRFYDVPNARDIAISKAERNAKRKLLDSELQERVLQAALTNGKVVTPTVVQQAQARRAVDKDSARPSRAQQDVEQARRRFWATAKELGYTTQREVHKAVGLACEEEPHEGDFDPNGRELQSGDPGVCRALSTVIAGWPHSHGGTVADGWRYMTEQLGGVEA
jgi:hypothetical protein